MAMNEDRVATAGQGCMRAGGNAMFSRTTLQVTKPQWGSSTLPIKLKTAEV